MKERLVPIAVMVVLSLFSTGEAVVVSGLVLPLSVTVDSNAVASAVVYFLDERGRIAFDILDFVETSPGSGTYRAQASYQSRRQMRRVIIEIDVPQGGGAELVPKDLSGERIFSVPQDARFTIPLE